ncbi:MAG: hypothetical protein GXP32_06335 [Kiritimatiellaeota bacterium]|nr:hypothetical protein [Kiritimatiellota bacterium]
MPLSSMEFELFESVEFYLALIGALPVPVFLVDDGDCCTTLTQLDTPQLRGIRRLFPSVGNNWTLDMEDSDSVIVKAVVSARAGNERVSVKGAVVSYKHGHPPDEDLYIMAHAVPSKISGKQYVIVIVEDITELETLKGILSICMKCNKIYNSGTKEWDRLEKYISSNSGASFSHGLCPECADVMKEELESSNWGQGSVDE